MHSNSAIAYRLHLNNQCSWSLVAKGELVSWLAKFARLMRLKACLPDGLPKIIFKKQKTGPLVSFSPRFSYRNQTNNIDCVLPKIDDPRINNLMFSAALEPVHQKVQSIGGISIHAALIEKCGRGVLLAGPSGSGKSTCCARLRRPWKQVCDDQVLILPTGGNKYVAHPLPTWSQILNGKRRSWAVEKPVELCAIFFLKKGKKDRAFALDKAQAAAFIYLHNQQIFFQANLTRELRRKLKNKLFSNACKITASLPCFTLNATLKGKFWEKIEEAISFQPTTQRQLLKADS
ncbi:MAG: SynChlorMet cassette protein ScmC [Candidatus Omnitrophica bacterium]|nr:SynChlorMet cassette protein ScmC [Candidatus Omnitrophota bacterium]